MDHATGFHAHCRSCVSVQGIGTVLRARGAAYEAAACLGTNAMHLASTIAAHVQRGIGAMLPSTDRAARQLLLIYIMIRLWILFRWAYDGHIGFSGQALGSSSPAPPLSAPPWLNLSLFQLPLISVPPIPIFSIRPPAPANSLRPQPAFPLWGAAS